MFTVRRAKLSDYAQILDIYAEARRFMREHGNGTQWGDNRPTAEEIEADICRGELYLIADGQKLCAVFAFVRGEEQCYEKIEGEWLSPPPYAAIHKVASSFEYRGMLHRICEFAKGESDHLKIDTHSDNYVMQNALEKEGFSRRGIIHLSDGQPRIAYEYLSDATRSKNGTEGT